MGKLAEKDLERARKFLSADSSRQHQTCKQIKKIDSALILCQAILAVANKSVLLIGTASNVLDRAKALGANDAIIEEMNAKIKEKYNELCVAEDKADKEAADKLWADNLEELKKKGLVTEPLKEGFYRARVYRGQNRIIEIKRCYTGYERLAAWFKMNSRSTKEHWVFGLSMGYSLREKAQQEIEAIKYWEIKAA